MKHRFQRLLGRLKNPGVISLALFYLLMGYLGLVCVAYGYSWRVLYQFVPSLTRSEGMETAGKIAAVRTRGMGLERTYFIRLENIAKEFQMAGQVLGGADLSSDLIVGAQVKVWAHNVVPVVTRMELSNGGVTKELLSFSVFSARMKELATLESNAGYGSIFFGIVLILGLVPFHLKGFPYLRKKFALQ